MEPTKADIVRLQLSHWLNRCELQMKRFFVSRIVSLKYAINGIAYVLRTQKNTWIYTLITIFVILGIVMLRLDLIEVSLLITAICIVWIAEFFNTMVETLVDMVSPNYNPKAKVVKDISAASVLLAAIMAASIGILIIVPEIIEQFPLTQIGSSK